MEHGRAEPVDVRPVVHGLGVLRLLRRDVGERAEAVSLGRERLYARPVQVLRDPEVGELGRPVGVEQDVARLHVAVDDARLRRRREGHGDVVRDRERLGERERPGGEPVLGGRALDELHDDVGAVLVDAHVVDLDDEGRVDARREPPLAEEALAGGGPGGVLRLEALYGHGASEPPLLGDVDLPARSLADLAQDLEVLGEVGERGGEALRDRALLAGELDLDVDARLSELEEGSCARVDALVARHVPAVEARAVPAPELGDLEALGRERDRDVPARDPLVVDPYRRLAAAPEREGLAHAHDLRAPGLRRPVLDRQDRAHEGRPGSVGLDLRGSAPHSPTVSSASATEAASRAGKPIRRAAS